MVFFLSGAVGIAWVLWWTISYSGSSSVTPIDTRALARRSSVRKLLSIRTVQALVFAKFMSDSA
jgi:ACS family hexuronate transporter-like MFS transporter